MTAIEIRNVTKRFSGVCAVDDLSLEVPEDSIYGFIGPNGSGKTTTIRMIMNILAPDTGGIRVFGHDSRSAVRDNVGYLPEERGLYKRMTVRQSLRYFGQLKGRSLAQLDPIIEKWLDRFHLREWADKKVQTLSKGMGQKVQFMVAVIAQPKLLILDEPFSGLDPVNADALRDAVLDLKRNGATVIFSTHDMRAAEQLCDRIFMIFKGRKVLDGTLDDIQSQFGKDTIRVRSGLGAAELSKMTGVEAIVDAGNFQDVRLNGDVQAFLLNLAQKTSVFHFELKKPSLHDIFVRIAQPTAEELKAPAGERQ